jgi:hypothetical protein
MAAPLGNQNTAKAKQWQMAIERALETHGAGDRRAALDQVAGKVVELALTGERWAVEEIGNRLDGKASQPIGGATDLGPVEASIRVLYGDTAA